MIRSIRFQNYKALRDATLPLERFTLLVGANGTGKSSVLEALCALGSNLFLPHKLSSGSSAGNSGIAITMTWSEPYSALTTRCTWSRSGPRRIHEAADSSGDSELNRFLVGIRGYWLEAHQIAKPVQLQKGIELGRSGENLAGVLDGLRDGAPERFALLNQALSQWFPEYDQVLFEVPGPGQRSILLRTRVGNHKIPASELSQGTLIGLALLTLVYQPSPPSLICLEEPDRGLHPRLLKDVCEAISRLTHPEAHGESRAPVQVIATTHSPYFLELYRDRPEEVVIAQKSTEGVRFERLADRQDIHEILDGAHLGDVWYSGILGGIPEHG